MTIVLLAVGSGGLFAQDCDCGPESLKPFRAVVSDELLASLPFSNIVHIRVKRWYSRSYLSTATFINNDVLITAHHNVIRKAHIRKLWIEGQTQNGRKEVLVKKRDLRISFFRKKFNTNSDIAAISIRNRARIRDFVLSEIEVSDLNTLALPPAQMIHLTGFPCDTPDKLVDKSTLMSGSLVSVPDRLVGYPMYTCVGDSGAPLWAQVGNKFHIIGIHHGGNEGIGLFSETDLNISACITPDVLSWLNGFIGPR